MSNIGETSTRFGGPALAGPAIAPEASDRLKPGLQTKLYYLGKPEDGFGWGVANTNLVRALTQSAIGNRQSAIEVIVDTSDRRAFDAPVFVPIADHNLTPLRRVRAPRVIGYCFTEWPIGNAARKNALLYDHIFCGSTWNKQRLEEHGIRAEVLHQGIDFERFQVQPWVQFQVHPSSTLYPPSSSEDTAKEDRGLKVEDGKEHTPADPSSILHPPSSKFVVFSGGKYEFRKGQDYVVAALRLFMAMHPDVVLLAAWHNPWPASAASMAHSWLLRDPNNPFAEFDPETVKRVIRVPPMRNYQTPALYAQAHVGVFPNRCEAGTNMVMCEFMACGRPVIATLATGHADVFLNPSSTLYPPSSSGEKEDRRWKIEDGPYLLTRGTTDPAGWFNPNVSDIITHLEHAYNNRADLPARGLACRALVERFTWAGCAEKVIRAAFPLTQ